MPTRGNIDYDQIKAAARTGTGNRLATAATGTLTQNVPLLYDASGNVIATATRSGNTTEFATVSGALTSGDIILCDASGNLVDGGAGFPLPQNKGGTGTGSPTATSAANTFVYRDANGNAFANNFSSAGAKVTASGITFPLTAATPRLILLSGGSSGETFKLPDATTLTVNTNFQFNNNSTGVLTIINNASGAITTMQPNTALQMICTDTSTAAGSWDYHWLLASTVPVSAKRGNTTVPQFADSATNPTSGDLAKFDASGNIADSGVLASSLLSNPMTTKGDIIVAATGGTPARLAVGTNGQVLTANSAATNGEDWEAPIALTTTGTSGAATLTPGNPYTLNVPQYSGGGGGPNKVVVWTSPSAASFAWINQGTASQTTNADNSITLTGPVSNGDVMRAFAVSVPGATPWDQYAAFSFYLGHNSGSPNFGGNGGMMLYDGTKATAFYWSCFPSNNTLVVGRWTNVSTFSARVYAQTDLLIGPYSFMRIGNDGTNLKFYVSNDGFNWQSVYSELVGAFMGTLTKIGFFCYSDSSAPNPQAQLLSWSTAAFTAA